MGIVDAVVSEIVGGAVIGASERRRRARVRRKQREFVAVLRTPWLTFAGVCMLVVLAIPAALVVGLGVLLVAAFRDDTLGVFILMIFGPFALGGIVAILPVIASGLSLVRRAFAQDGSTRVEVLCAGLAGSLLSLVSLLASGYLPLVLLVAPPAALVAIAASPAPWRRRLQIEWSSATSTVNS